MFNKFICSLFGHNWEIRELFYRKESNPIKRSSILNRKGGKKRTLFPNSYKIKTEKCWYCKRCGKIIKYKNNEKLKRS